LIQNILLALLLPVNALYALLTINPAWSFLGIQIVWRMLECGLIVNFLIFVSKKKAQSTKNSFASSEKRVEEQSAGYSFSEINNISMEFNKDFITVSENTINK